MEENKVVLKLENYIDLIGRIKELNQKLEYKDRNYVGMINYLKDTVRKQEDYQIKNFNGNINDSISKKVQDYHYKNIVDGFLSKGLTFDLAAELTDELIEEGKMNNECSE